MISTPFRSRVKGMVRAHAWPLLLGLLLRGAFFIWNAHEVSVGRLDGRWAAWDPDQWEYIGTAESYLAGEGWQPDHRMPGYAVIFLLFRQVFSYRDACDAITIAHLLVSVLAVYAFSRALATAAGAPRLFWPAYVLSLLAVYSALSDNVLVNESFTTSALMLHWATYVRYRHHGGWQWLLASGALIGLAAFLRPVYAPILAMVPLAELLRSGQRLPVRSGLALLFCIPFLVADGIWTWRNHRHYGGFHPLTNHGSWNPRYSKSPLYAGTELLSTWGGHSYWWEPSSDSRWIGFDPQAGYGTGKPVDGVPEPPAYVHTKRFTRDSLVHFAIGIRTARALQPGPVRDSISLGLLAMAHRWRADFAHEQPFQYQVMARLRLLKHQAFTSGSQVLFKRSVGDLTKLEVAYKLLQSAFYWWALALGGLAAVFALLRARRYPLMALLGAMAIYALVCCPWIMRAAEIRYMIPVFHLLLGLGIWGGALLVARFRGRATGA